jgi:hypothetical protein
LFLSISQPSIHDGFKMDRRVAGLKTPAGAVNLRGGRASILSSLARRPRAIGVNASSASL